MTLHADALRVLESWTPPDAEQEARRGEYVDHLRAHADGYRKDCFPTHLTAGALVVDADGSRVLLNLHRKARRWFAFGGHLEPTDATLASAALREAVEESGIPTLRLDPVPVHLSAHQVEFCSPRGSVRHLDVRFLAQVVGTADPVVSEESLELGWFDADRVPTDEPDMLDLIRLARERLTRAPVPADQSQASRSSIAAEATPSR